MRWTPVLWCVVLLAACNDVPTSKTADTASLSGEAWVVAPDALAVVEAGTAAVEVAANDTVPPTARIEPGTDPSHGTVTWADGVATYTHDGSESGEDHFTYVVRDGVRSEVAVVVVTVDPVNDPPEAADDVASVGEGGAVVVAVALNDVDVDDGLDLDSLEVTAAAVGTLDIGAGIVTYTHDGSAVADDAFTYTIADLSGARSAPATVRVTVSPEHDPPVAVADAATLAEGGSVDIDVLSNDAPGDHPLGACTVLVVDPPANGTASAEGGVVAVTHDGSETSSDRLTYRLVDPTGAASAAVEVLLTVTPVNDAPTASDGVLAVDEGGVGLAVLMLEDVDDVDLSVEVDVWPVHGEATVDGGVLRYVHDGSETEADALTYRARDAAGALSAPATVVITVSPQNDPPVAVDDVAVVEEGGAASVFVLANDVDPDGDALTVLLVDAPLLGTAEVVDGAIRYTHDGSDTLADTFAYRVVDPVGAASDVATVAVTVVPVDDAPASADLSTGLTWTGDVGDRAGLAVAWADTDGDGASELVVGAPSWAGETGGVYLVSDLDSPGALASGAAVLRGETTHDQAGSAIVAVDVDGDGADELLVGVPGHDGAGVQSGAVALVAGPDGAVALGEATIVVGGSPWSYGGGALAAAGDTDGDGIVELLIGADGASDPAPWAGAVWLVRADLSGLDTISDGAGIVGTAGDQFLGAAVTGAGDTDGDGLADVAVGAPGASDDAGLVALFRGPLSGVRPVSSAGLTWTGAVAGDHAGTALAGGWDLTGDGLDDVVLGADGAGGRWQGAAYVVSGAGSGVVDLGTAPALTGAEPEAFVGVSVALGDADADGAVDLLIGADGMSGSGVAYLVYGPVDGPLDLERDAHVRLVGAAADDHAGVAVAIGPDGQLLVGAAGDDAGGAEAGAVTLFPGVL